LDAGAIVEDFGGAVISQILEKICAVEHPTHGAPVRVVSHKPCHDQSFALNVD
jgi:hypothetical protein